MDEVFGLDCIFVEDVKTSLGSNALDSQEYPYVTTKASVYGLLGKKTYNGIALAEKVASSLQGQGQPIRLGKWQLHRNKDTS